MEKDKAKQRLAYDEEMEILSRQLAEGIIDETQYMKFGDKLEYEYEYRNITSIIKGLYNIKEAIKNDLDYFMSLPYVLKVDVVQVVINKMDILNFCNDHKIRCFGYDWMMKEFISNRDLNIDFHSHLPAFVFILMTIIFI